MTGKGTRAEEPTLNPGADAVPRFARGYVLSDRPAPRPVPEWLTQDVAGLTLTHAPDLAVSTARAGRHFVTLIGHFFDTSTWRPRHEAMTEAVGALARSEDAFLDVADHWSGRYLIVFGTDASRRLMTDATGMRSAFYTLGGSFVVASHARLVATAVDAPRSAVADAHRDLVREAPTGLVTLMPGRSTPWEGVVFLTANQVLDVETRELRRIFPRTSLPALTSTATAALLAPRLQGQMSALVGLGRPVALSLTAGVDSRVSLAASRPVRDEITYFTYRRPGLAGTEADVKAAESMARDLHLPHRVLEVTTTAEPTPLDAAIREATFLNHSRAVVAAYRRAFTPDTMHVRSNVGEIGRSYHRIRQGGHAVPDSADAVSAEVLARLAVHGTPSQPIIDAFEEWMDATGFRAVQGIDPLDVFYWEHRMSCWHSSLVLESDFAFDTHVIFNSRSILELMLSAPAGDRRSGKLMREVVRAMWPELLRWPMGTRSLRSRLASLARRRLG